MQSDYLKTLLSEYPEVGERYQMKVKVIDRLDPFTLKYEDLNTSIDGIPPVTSMDIIAYLVLTHSYYTKEQMKAFKSLNAYKYFEAGFILQTGTTVVNNFFILCGKVKHSQRANVKPVDVWCIIAKDGSIALDFHASVVMPELLGKYFTKHDGASQHIRWCICKGVDDGRPMIKCEIDSCIIQWFHFECVGLTDAPDIAWVCNKCQNI